MGSAVIVSEMLKKGLSRIISQPIVYRAFSFFTRNNVIIFFLHRFEDADNDVQGYSAAVLEESLSFLQREGYRFVSLAEIIQNHAGDGARLNKAVCFTMDDGFLDQATIAAPIFEKYSCPVTVFLITGFLDGKLWPWDEQVRYIFSETKHLSVEVKIGRRMLHYDFSEKTRHECMRMFREICKSLPDEEVSEAIEFLSLACGVRLTVKPPISYQPMTWEMARLLEKKGVTFGCHGVSHRIASRMTSKKLMGEMSESWFRLEQELINPMKVFCFPTGRYGRDYTFRDVNILRGLEFKAGLSSDPGYISFKKVHDYQRQPYMLPRFSFPNRRSDLIKIIAGIEGVKDLLMKSPLEVIKNNYGSKKGAIKYLHYRTKYFLGAYGRQVHIEWDKVTRLIFICKGNICRSPFAEVFARNLHVDTLSFGVETRGGDVANQRAMEIAREYGVDLSLHKTKKIEEYDAQSGDLIVAMEPSHIEMYDNKMMNVEGSQKTLLGLWGGVPNPYIHDPYNANDAYFRACFILIINSIEAMHVRLRSYL